MQSFNILIAGYGNIGRHLYFEFGYGKTYPNVNLWVYDKLKPTEQLKPFEVPDNYTNNLENFKDVKFDFAFVCVPTEMKENGECCIAEVIDAVESIKNTLLVDTIVIKSTIPVGTCSMIKEKITENIIFSPEYYGTTIHAPSQVNFVILGGDRSYSSKVADFYYTIKSNAFRVRFTDFKTAELAKYMENCFLATKVAFCSEFSIIARDMGIDYHELREIFIMDERMGESHTLIQDNQPYYDSHCLNKDIPALIKQHPEAKLMKAVKDINDERKSKFKK